MLRPKVEREVSDVKLFLAIRAHSSEFMWLELIDGYFPCNCVHCGIDKVRVLLDRVFRTYRLIAAGDERARMVWERWTGEGWQTSCEGA